MILKLKIEAPIEMVFEYIINPDYRMGWLKDTIDIRYPIRDSIRALGAAFVQIRRIGGKPLTFQGTNTSVDPPYLFRYRLTDERLEWESVFRLKRFDYHTELELTYLLKGRTPIFDIMAKVASRFSRRSVARELELLKALCEDK